MDARLVGTLRRIRLELADEFLASEGGLMSPVAQAVMRARDALNDALEAAGSPEEQGWRDRHCTIDEMLRMRQTRLP